jgi:hemerythrin superfamily protein
MIPESINVLTSFDMLEHLKYQHIHAALTEWTVRAKHIMVTVSTEPAVTKDRNGNHVHLTVRSYRWWHKLFERYFDDVRRSKRNHGAFFMMKGRGDAGLTTPI